MSYYPSRQSRLYSRYQSLNSSEKIAVTREIDGQATFNSAEYRSLKRQSKQRTLDTLIDYYQYLREPEKLLEDPKNTSYRKTLLERFTLPPDRYSLKTNTKNAPHLGRKPSLFQVSLTHNRQLGPGVRLRLRPAYYDALDSDEGHIGNSMLSMAELEVRTIKGQMRLSRLDLVNIESIKAQSTGLPGDGSFAWTLNFGLHEAANNCVRDCLVTRFQGSMGYTLPTTRGVLAGALLGGALQESELGQGPAVASATFFSDIESAEGVKTRMSVEHRAYAFGPAPSRNHIRLESHYQHNNEFGFRAYIEKSQTLEMGLSLARYF